MLPDVSATGYNGTGLKECLGDPDAEVRAAAIGAVAFQKQAPETAVPLLISALADTNQSVAIAAANYLPGFGTNAYPVLSNLVESGDPPAADVALGSLKALAPEEALRMILRDVRSSQAALRIRVVQALQGYTVGTPGVVEALNLARTDADPRVGQDEFPVSAHSSFPIFNFSFLTFNCYPPYSIAFPME